MQLLKKKKTNGGQEFPTTSDHLQYYNVHTKKAFRDFTLQMLSLKEKIQLQERLPVFLCIGSDRATGDCFGPIVGSKLLQTFTNTPSHLAVPAIYGTLQKPVHAVNLSAVIKQIYTTLPNAYIIAIDASLGIRRHIGYVTFGAGPLLPGIGVQKKLPGIGNSAITGIVNLAGQNSHVTLQTTQLSTVVELALFVSEAITEAFTS